VVEYYWLLLLGAFIAGAIPFGWLVARVFFRADIRSLGSGNIGMANVWRNFGAAAGLATLILDVAKGFAPVFIARYVLSVPFYAESTQTALLLSGVALLAIFGHTFTPFLNFRGGKGIATGLGVMLALLGVYALIPLGVFVIVFALFRIVSLGSLTAAIGLLAATALLSAISAYLYLAIAATVLIFFTHRENIARLVKGTEPRLELKRRA